MKTHLSDKNAGKKFKLKNIKNIGLGKILIFLLKLFFGSY